MASLDGLPFRPLDAAAPSSGAAFLLARPAPLTAAVTLGDWQVALVEGSNYVVGRGGLEGDYRRALVAGLDQVQRGLDYLCATGKADLATVDPADEHFVWWPEQGGLVLRSCCTVVVKSDIETTATVHGAGGRPRASPTPVPLWHESMRFYRQAQLAEEPFEAVRSLWLATENLLDDIHTWTSSESESKWVARAFRAAATHIDLSLYLPASNKAPHNAAHDYFYDELRKDLFHAKASRAPALPHDVEDTARIIERHERLTRLYLDLLGTVVGVRRGGGLMTYAGFDAYTAAFAVGSSVHVSDDRSPLQESDTSPNPGGGVDLVAPLIPQPALSLPGRCVLLGTFAGAQLETLDAVRRTGVTHDDAVIERGVLMDIDAPRGLLDASGLERFEVQYTWRLHNMRQPLSFTAV